jgi:hypothetical protein
MTIDDNINLQSQFIVNDLEVSHWIHFPLDMNNVIIIESTFLQTQINEFRIHAKQ